MTADARRRSPLADVELASGIRELPFLSQVTVRAGPSAVASTFPTEPNIVRSVADRWILWLGPDEWLIVGPPDTLRAIEADVRAQLGHELLAMVDTSGNRTTLELSGPNARDVLESGCSIDLDSGIFSPGRCAQTLLARAGVILWHVEAGTYRILVRPSFAAHVASWIEDAVRSSMGVAVDVP
jgi:sarcosine oxidase, subunit gamma